MKQAVLLSACLSAALLSCHKDSPPSSLATDFTYTGTLQNFTPLQFNSQAGGATSYEWSFGDGSTSADANPTHTYRRAGTYSVKLRATGASGSTGEASKTLTLAQADTAALVLDSEVGQYRFGKVIRYTFRSNGSTAPPTETYTRLRDTTFAITRQGRELSVYGFPLAFKSSSAPWPVGSRYPNYYFEYGVPSNYAKLYAQQQGDSVIFTRRNGGLGDWTIHTYYGKRVR